MQPVSSYRLIHQTKGDLVVTLVLCRDLRPKTSELCVCGPTLSYDRTVPTCVVVNVNNAKCGTGVQATLNLFIIGRPVAGIEGATKVIVQKELPSNWDPEGVKPVVVDKVLHLVDTSLSWVYDTRRLACPIDGAAEVETCNLSPGSLSAVFD